MNTRRGPRRKHVQHLQFVGGIVDLGGMGTPPLFPQLSHAMESDLRSTANDCVPSHRVEGRSSLRPDAEQGSCESAPSDDENLDSRSKCASLSPIYPTWTPINGPSMRPRKPPLDLAAFSLRNGYSWKSKVELRMNEIFGGEEDLVDRQDGRVYHQGHKYHDFDGLGTSYSFVFLDDDPKLLPAQVQQWKNKQTKIQREIDCPVLENDVRHMLETGSALLVERTGPEQHSEGTYGCLLSECPYEVRCFPPGHFYIALRSGRQMWPLPRPFCFCLPCFERLWKGEFSRDPGPGPAGVKVIRKLRPESGPEPQTTASKPNNHGSESPLRFDTPFSYLLEVNLDGAMDLVEEPTALRMSSLCSSRHAPPEMASSPLLHVDEGDDNTLDDSPGSTNSRGDWVVQLARVQHIAAFFKPGNSLNKLETAVVNLWKAASFEQLQWVRHMEKTHYLREYQAGDSLVDKSIHMEQSQIEDVDGEEIDETAAEALVKLPKGRFRGCSLADVWMVMRKECEGFA